MRAGTMLSAVSQCRTQRECLGSICGMSSCMNEEMDEERHGLAGIEKPALSGLSGLFQSPLPSPISFLPQIFDLLRTCPTHSRTLCQEYTFS